MVLTPPDALSDEGLVRVLRDGWGVVAASVEYRAVGFGSHHWNVLGADGLRRFLTVDDLETKRESLLEPATRAYERLQAALATARELRRAGASFVVAPIPTVAGEPVVRTEGRFAAALYPYVEGESYAWGDFSTPAHRAGVLDCLVALHGKSTSTLPSSTDDGLCVPHRDELGAALEAGGAAVEEGPYARLVSQLLIRNADKIRRLLARYDDLVHEHRHEPVPTVVTHGEPHAGNTMLTAAGWVLVDWDTALLAPPERDLWSLDPGDGSALRAYAGATGVVPRPLLLELYAVRWDLADIAACVSQLRAARSDRPDDQQSWDVLSALIARLPG